MGQQYIETIGFFGKKIYKEYPSELQCYNPEELKEVLLSLVFNQQYGIFYYEPSSSKEAQKMILKFKEKIRELEDKYLVYGE